MFFVCRGRLTFKSSVYDCAHGIASHRGKFVVSRLTSRFKGRPTGLKGAKRALRYKDALPIEVDVSLVLRSASIRVVNNGTK